MNDTEVIEKLTNDAQEWGLEYEFSNVGRHCILMLIS